MAKKYIVIPLSYKGPYKNGKPHGQGMLYFSDGKTYYEGLFEEGKPVDAPYMKVGRDSERMRRK